MPKISPAKSVANLQQNCSFCSLSLRSGCLIIGILWMVYGVTEFILYPYPERWIVQWNSSSRPANIYQHSDLRSKHIGHQLRALVAVITGALLSLGVYRQIITFMLPFIAINATFAVKAINKAADLIISISASELNDFKCTNPPPVYESQKKDEMIEFLSCSFVACVLAFEALLVYNYYNFLARELDASTKNSSLPVLQAGARNSFENQNHRVGW